MKKILVMLFGVAFLLSVVFVSVQFFESEKITGKPIGPAIPLNQSDLNIEIPVLALCVDKDNDGWMLQNDSSQCTIPKKFYGFGDCNDINPNVYPNATDTWCDCNSGNGGSFSDGSSAEICGNGIDEDCSGADLPCPTTCADTDGGQNYIIKGTVSNDSLTFPDDCLDTIFLNESSCDQNGNVNFQIQDCLVLGLDPGFPGDVYGCKDGACVCQQNITLQDSICIDDTFTNFYEDQNNCIDPFNETGDYCDSNLNGLIGDFCLIEGVDSVFINNASIDQSINYSDAGIQKVELEKKNSLTEFDQDFATDTLNLCPVVVETADHDDNVGYIIIKNLDTSNKTVWFEKLDVNSDSVCIKDESGVNSINDFSDNCADSDEVLVFCPGTNAGYNCEVLSDQSGNFSWFKVWPLDHSGVLEFLPVLAEDLICPPENWTCSNWSDCVNGVQTRTCFDLNLCGTTLNKPNEIQNCVLPRMECIPDWRCSWGECQEDGFKYYTCEDWNACNTLEGKPEGDIFECKRQSKSLFLIIIVIVGLILVILGVLYFMSKRKQRQEEVGEGQAPVTPSVTPPSPPVSPVETPVTPASLTYTPQEVSPIPEETQPVQTYTPSQQPATPSLVPETPT